MAMSFKKRLLRAKERIGLAYEARQLPSKPFSIISDDCWGGQIYRYHKLPYLTPTVGLQVMHADYINFIRNLRQPDFLDFKEEPLTEKYPTIRNAYALLLCVHYSTAQEAIETFRRRYQRIVWNNMYYKIDFGKPWYSQQDVNEWNEMKLDNAIALFYPDLAKRGKRIGHVHRGIAVPNWRRDGSKMYFASRRYFDIMEFLASGRLRRSSKIDDVIYKILVDVWWLNDKLRPKSASNLSFATEIESMLTNDPQSAPPPYEAEVK